MKENLKSKPESARLSRIIKILKQEYPEARIALDFKSPFQLLIATILSAQCTDERVNQVTPALFRKYPDPESFANADLAKLEKDIFSTGFYHQKAKNIILCSREILDTYQGSVPNEMEQLVKLPGVGRKTASVVMGNGYGIPAIAVDTHCVRLSNLLGFVETKDAVKIEMRLRELAEPEDWIILSHLFAYHGRKTCIARRPDCQNCVISSFCPSAQK
ncbi:MAG: Ultraviolet N-glycosylase/AP lyase [Ignavibacteriaceae bacterium]|nr:Ultraviolet N-glycosylase/AP lyase [Ignavibacteriaceae bacterium]